ncbi:MAG: hypothetical protein AAB402_03635 [Patescibacteria group bacterium]
MSLKLNQEIWVYAERLYIHCYSAEDFKIFLKKFGIEYNSGKYSELAAGGSPYSIPLYSFMSEPNYDFANFMQTVPSYKYLPILQEIVFDSKIIGTRNDGWNYYGEYIKNWHQLIVNLLRATGVNFDNASKKLSVLEIEEDFVGPDYLPYDFNDLFLDYIRKEINESYLNGQLLAVIILSRKLLEALVVRICEIVFPKIVNGSYNQGNHEIWYDKNKGRYRGLELLLSNIRSKSTDFHEDKELLEQVCDDIEQIRVEANKFVHKDYKIPSEDYLKSLKVESAVVTTRKLYKKYCNP